MLNSWQTRTAQELDQTIRTWGEMMNSYNIPITAYPELYRRGFDVRQERMRAGGDVPQMDATLLVSQWTGPHGLKQELHRKEIDRARTLPENAEMACDECYGSGFKQMKCVDGSTAVTKCDHRQARKISL